jgi:hypothetical protein
VVGREALLRLVSLIDRLTGERGEAGCRMSVDSPPEPGMAGAAGIGSGGGGAAAGCAGEPGCAELRGEQP